MIENLKALADAVDVIIVVISSDTELSQKASGRSWRGCQKAEDHHG